MSNVHALLVTRYASLAHDIAIFGHGHVVVVVCREHVAIGLEPAYLRLHHIHNRPLPLVVGICAYLEVLLRYVEALRCGYHALVCALYVCPAILLLMSNVIGHTHYLKLTAKLCALCCIHRLTTLAKVKDRCREAEDCATTQA